MSFHGGHDPDADQLHDHAVSRFDAEGPLGQTAAADSPDDLEDGEQAIGLSDKDGTYLEEIHFSRIFGEAVALTKLLQIDPLGFVCLHLRKAGPDTGPDIGGGLTLDPNLTDEDKQLLLDLKSRLKDSGILMLFLEIYRLENIAETGSIAGGASVEDLKQFFAADFPKGLHADPDRAAATVCLKAIFEEFKSPVAALLYCFRSMNGDHDGIDYGGRMTLYADLSEEDKQAALKWKAMMKLNGFAEQLLGGMPGGSSDLQRLKEFFDADLPESVA